MQPFQKFLLVFILLFSAKTQGQYVLVPDSNFRKFIKQKVDSTAIVDNNLDTTNVKLVSKKYLYISGGGITDLYGIQFFDSLQELTLDYLSVQSLIPFSSDLKKLTVSHSNLLAIDSNNTSLEVFNLNSSTINDFSSVPKSVKHFNSNYSNYEIVNFPDSLITLRVNSNNQLDTVVEFPPELKDLKLISCPFTELPSVPDSVNAVYLYRNQNLSVMRGLPELIDSLSIIDGNLAQIDNLPQSLLYLNIYGQGFDYIDSLPLSLKTLILTFSGLDSIGSLPPLLEELNLSGNNFHLIPPLPSSMISLAINNNPLDVFPVLGNTLQALSCNNTLPCLPKLPDSLHFISYDHCLPNKPTPLIDEDLSVCDVPYIYTEGPDGITCDDTISVVPGLSYLWSNGDTVSSIAGVCKSTFEVEYIDSSGCYYKSSINLTDTALHHSVRGISDECTGYGNCDLFLDVTVNGGTPPYTYQWLDFDGTMNDTNQLHNQDVFDLCCWDIQQQYYLECIITDAAGRVDIVQAAVEAYDPPAPGSIGYGVANPLCPGVNDGFYYLFDAVNIPGGNINVVQCSIDTSYTVYTEYWGPGCETDFAFDPEYMFDSVDSVTAFTVDTPLCGMCDGQVNFRYDYFDEPYMSRSIWHYVMDTITWDDHESSLCLNTVYYVSSIIDYSSGMCNYSQYELPWDTIYITRSGCTAVYSGDANNDGVANNIDLLSIGLAYGDTGSVRVDTIITWDAKYVQNWTTFFADSVNHKHADCNGNGIVNDDDTTAIILNFGFTHSRPASSTFIAGVPSLNIDLPALINSNSPTNVPIILGDSFISADSVYGIAFSIYYNNTIIDESTIQFNVDNSWLGNSADLLMIQHINAGRLDIAVTRKDHLSISGAGEIGRLRFQTTDTTAYLLMNTANIVAIADDGTFRTINTSLDSTTVADTNLVLLMISSPEMDCSSRQYDVYLTITGGTPPYKYQWSSSDPNVSLSGICDTCQNLLNIDFGGFYPDGMSVKCVVEDSVGIIDSLEHSFVPNYPPDIFWFSIDQPICPELKTGGVWIYSGLNPPGPSIGVYETLLDSGDYDFSQTYGNGCIYEIKVRLDYSYQSCDSFAAFYVTPADCGQCNGEVVSNISEGYTYRLESFGYPLCNDTLTGVDFHVSDISGGDDYYAMILVALDYPGCTAVYPGDANNDGVANNIDLLSIGLAYGDTGSVRVDTTITWDAKYVQNWTTFFADSVNHKQADCNGNGIVNDDDTTAILLNYGLPHQRMYNNQHIAGAPSLQIDLPDTLTFNTTYQVPVLLGNSINAATNIYGIAFSIDYDQTVVIPNSVQFIIDSNWLGSNNNDLIYLQHSDPLGGKLDVAITRKDHSSRNGYGTIGALQFKTKTLFNDQAVYFNSANITAISHDEIYQPVNSSTDSALFQSLICEINTTASVFNACNNWCGSAIQLNISDATGSLHYDWSILQMDSAHCIPSLADTVFLAGLPTGIYTCIITDSVGCADTISASVIAEISTLEVSALTNNEGCDSCDGSISLTIMGGYAPYTFHWDTLSGNIGNNSYSTQTLSSICLNATAFECVVTDSLGCETWYDELFTDNRCFPAGWSDNIIPECLGSSLGYLAFFPIGFSSCYSYTGVVTSSPPGTTVDYSYYPTVIIHNAQAGIYEYTLISGDGCDTSNSLSFEVPVIDLQVVTTNPICGQCNGKAIALVNGDTLLSPPGVFEWNHDTLISNASIDSFICQNQQVGYSISVDGCLIDDSFILDTCTVVQLVDNLNSPSLVLFKIIPNPNHGNFVLELAQRAITNSSIEIINIIGETIYWGELQKGEDKKEITLTQLSSGIYYCRLINNYNVLQQLFVVR